MCPLTGIVRNICGVLWKSRTDLIQLIFKRLKFDGGEVNLEVMCSRGCIRVPIVRYFISIKQLIFFLPLGIEEVEKVVSLHCNKDRVESIVRSFVHHANLTKFKKDLFANIDGKDIMK